MLHDDRTRAESFGADPEQYDRARPRYPQALIDRILEAGPEVSGRPPKVLDVGCGTGIASRMFASAGCRVLGVEIDPRMAAVARGSGIDVEVAPFESWNAKDRSFDFLISGQAWHWVNPYDGAIKAGQILRPGGRIALFWNFGQPDEAIAARFNDVYHRVAPGLDGYSVLLGYPGEERLVHGREGLDKSGRFASPQQWTIGWERTYNRQQWLDQLPTHSDHRTLPPEQLAGLLTDIGSAIEDFGGQFVIHYTVAVLTALRS